MILKRDRYIAYKTYVKGTQVSEYMRAYTKKERRNITTLTDRHNYTYDMVIYLYIFVIVIILPCDGRGLTY